MSSIVSVAGCGRTNATANADGFRRIPLKADTVHFLVANDPPAADAILSHNEYGERIGAWEAPQ